MKAHTYAGTIKSAIARAKRILVGEGFPWSVTTGRYSPYFNEQKTTDGVKVTRVGYSDTIALSVRVQRIGYSDEARAQVRLIEGLAIGALREGGLPVDDRGWLICTGETLP